MRRSRSFSRSPTVQEMSDAHRYLPLLLAGSWRRATLFRRRRHAGEKVAAALGATFPADSAVISRKGRVGVRPLRGTVGWQRGGAFCDHIGFAGRLVASARSTRSGQSERGGRRRQAGSRGQMGADGREKAVQAGRLYDVSTRQLGGLSHYPDDGLRRRSSDAHCIVARLVSGRRYCRRKPDAGAFRSDETGSFRMRQWIVIDRHPRAARRTASQWWSGGRHDAMAMAEHRHRRIWMASG